ncbi:peptidyl-prolyl cis-trans isomerase FKBP14-like isoform X2 [Synchiropus splendidus]|uniref:peptidyl-prolyl cis-trans isomerase FKBP14-like isoform X2 n=1 Tax=Synchiropus splendidus TaxID=270530 RepID=UPI00237D905D|nr:peptidyl-prolyl cis-trans isomerase FKBP14-like isoform X2 [Synchiropus splendidus]
METSCWCTTTLTLRMAPCFIPVWLCHKPTVQDSPQDIKPWSARSSLGGVESEHHTCDTLPRSSAETGKTRLIPVPAPAHNRTSNPGVRAPASEVWRASTSPVTLYHGPVQRQESRAEGDKQPVWFTLGIREVIRGWDKGLQDMCAGEKRKLIVPPALAYGKDGKGKIPPESTLTFFIEVLEIRNGPRSHESFQEMDLNDDWRLSMSEVKQYLRKEFERHGYPPNDTLHENMMKDIFAKEDENKDGFISSREFTYKHDEL